MNTFFEKIIFFNNIESTNSELINNEYSDRTLIYTYNQTKGRGRFDRNWITFKNKALALSILIKNPNKISINEHFLLTGLLSITCIEFLAKEYNLKCRIKWPNDIYIKDKKLAGILTETAYTGKNNFKIVSGIGININVNEEELLKINKKATSLLYELEKDINIDLFTRKFIKFLSSNFLDFFNDAISKENIKKKWIYYCDILNKTVEVKNIFFDNHNFDNHNTVNNLESKFTGKVIGIDDEGFLIIKSKSKTQKIINGDVIILD